MNESQLTKKDYKYISIIGFLMGLLSLPVLSNIKLAFLEVNLVNSVVIVAGLTIFANIALWFSALVSHWIKIFLQIAKFCATGGLNTLLNLGVLNALIALTGYAAGVWYAVFYAIAFITANINSYIWNRYWTFGAKDTANAKEFGEFFVVSLVGLGLSVATAAFVVNVIGAPAGISLERWANVGALSATAISLVWNFVGYKFIVFKSKNV
ncbi:MAG: GtrA family protein [Candidatus Wolfebacteria bacterium]|nr:GtrA family protein [Candidatus Wolfebacteria bacterium]